MAARPAPAAAPVTNPRKVYWPEQGYTKGDLVAYYDQIADALLPYLRERPLHLYRWPDGVRGKSFYQKALPKELPDDVEVRVWDSTAELRYLVLPERPADTDGMSAEDLAALVTRDSMIGVSKLGGPGGRP